MLEANTVYNRLQGRPDEQLQHTSVSSALDVKFTNYFFKAI